MQGETDVAEAAVLRQGSKGNEVKEFTFEINGDTLSLTGTFGTTEYEKVK